MTCGCLLLGSLFPLLLLFFTAFNGQAGADSPMIIPGPCQEELFYYENYGSYKCIDGQKVFQNCVPLNEPHSQAIAINSTLITSHFRSICVQYAPDRVQYIRTHCVDSTGEMPKFMRANTSVEHADKKIRCIFDTDIQTLRKLIISKKKKRVCRHKKDQKVEQDVHFQCRRNAYVPDFCLGKGADGKDLRVELGQELSDGRNYVLSCQVLRYANGNANSTETAGKQQKRRKSKKKPVGLEAALRRVRCLHREFNSTEVKELQAGQSVEFADGSAIVYCLNGSADGEVLKQIETIEQNATDDCLIPFNSTDPDADPALLQCRGRVYKAQSNEAPQPLSNDVPQQILSNEAPKQVGCANLLVPHHQVALGQREISFDGSERECGDKMELVGCLSTTGKRLKLGESEGDPTGANGHFERCEQHRGLVIYNEGDECRLVINEPNRTCLATNSDDSAACNDVVVIGPNTVQLGQMMAIAISGVSLSPRVKCERKRLIMGDKLADNLEHKAFWSVLVHVDCVDFATGKSVPLNGSRFLPPSNMSTGSLLEFCLPGGGIQRGKGQRCKFAGSDYAPGGQFLFDQALMLCRPDGRVQKIGCFFAPANLELAVGAIEPMPNQPDILIHCEANGIGIRLTNGAKGCVKEETGEKFPFGSEDENSNSIRLCVRKAEPEVRGVWQLTHCLFGTMKVRRGECLFNRTSEQQNPTTSDEQSCQPDQQPQGEYKLCEQDANQQPVFLPASYEYCAPKSATKATNEEGQLIEEKVEEISKQSFECGNNWKPKPVPVGLNETSGELDEVGEEYSDEDSDEGDDNDVDDDALMDDDDDDIVPVLLNTTTQNTLATTPSMPAVTNPQVLQASVEWLDPDVPKASTTMKPEETTMAAEATTMPEEETTMAPEETTTMPEETTTMLEEATTMPLETTTPEEAATTTEEPLKTTPADTPNTTTTLPPEETTPVEVTTTEQSKIFIPDPTTESVQASPQVLQASVEWLDTDTPKASTTVMPEEATTMAAEETTTTTSPEPPSTTEEPTTEVPSTEVPSTEVPSTEVPTTEVPSTEVPTTEVPSTEVPSTEVPSTEHPSTTEEAPSPSSSSPEPPSSSSPEPSSSSPPPPPPTTEANLPCPNPGGFDQALNQALDQILVYEAEEERKRTRACGQKNADCDGQKVLEESTCRNRLSEHFCTAYKPMCLSSINGKLAERVRSDSLQQTIAYLRHFLGDGQLKDQLRVSSHFLTSEVASKYGNQTRIRADILKIASLLPLLSADDDLAELLIAQEGGPVLERMLAAKRGSDLECAIEKARCPSAPASSVSAELGLFRKPCSLQSPAADNVKCQRLVRRCVRAGVAKLRKQFEALLYHFRMQLDMFPHGALRVLCARTCGQCNPSGDSEWLAVENGAENALKLQLLPPRSPADDAVLLPPPSPPQLLANLTPI